MDQHRQSLLDPSPALFMPPAASGDKDVVAPAAQPAWVTGILSAFSAYPKVLLSIVVLLLLMLLLSVASIVLLVQTRGECDASDSSAPLSCGFGSHDLSSIAANDLPPYQVTTGGRTYTYYLHTCGRLITTACLQYPASQACMRIAPANTAYDIADYRAANGGGAWSQGDSGEVVYSSSSGGGCPTDDLKQLSLRVSYICQPQQQQPVINEVFNGLDPCEINFHVLTSAVC